MDNDKLNTTENVLATLCLDCEKTVIIHALTKLRATIGCAKLLGTTRRIWIIKSINIGVDREQFRCAG